MQSVLQAPELSLFLTGELIVMKPKQLREIFSFVLIKMWQRGMSPYSSLTTVKCHRCSPLPLVPKSPTQEMPNELPPCCSHLSQCYRVSSGDSKGDTISLRCQHDIDQAEHISMQEPPAWCSTHHQHSLCFLVDE